MPCPVCLSDYANKIKNNGADNFIVKCNKCGKYYITEKAIAQIEEQYNDIQRANLSGWLRKQPEPPFLDVEKVKGLKEIPTPTVKEKAQTLFNYLCKRYPIAGMTLEVLNKILKEVGSSKDKREEIASELEPIQGKCSISNKDELSYIVNEYLMKEENVINKSEGHYYISPKGWSFLEENKFSISETAFVAMSFNNKFDSLYENVIYPAIDEAGWKPLRIKEERHNNYITNEIISGIRQANFMVVDFTENCEGAYYEAGYAKGLGLPVIHIANEEYFDNEKTDKKLHFDTAQIFHLQWKEGNEEEDKVNLFHHIISTVGVGPKFTNR